ncbi:MULTISPECIES: beta-ketoacyl-ACP synthase II [unclassified Algoriphagus]|jgi:3-oxoacyl-[acyl-carrier-protein] synthase II|uniref:beta-ketoacyl-ACP synthase II n=2 Tax=Algoriphagus TaxID=246875 RepID=UPI000C38FC39|nr:MULTISPECIES: beta-ketoacyl-ACP synthase II [unclassified Algoriphagus]MAL13461.1 beta-ketoacyl-[acyl-carrier-protein] synthase II [Algoriphagus sp.]QYH38910.1 beta-ketoacyl-ACP synthase II [Algoriphagus sp. NBT04N3]HAD51673.1 beta-ketoacyl-[acyl-carrier-protein] synthase II [Algoriphagus sp.]HAH38329.1 beta-ketoacyl-[acyl-carrier-protein] synthase II [Algoriphagus sp.]HAS58936.1 beta-ketoacyl-[acyl-carrier-protein] synthase II [Algoriphagus sp.]|tara:strand:+ start:1283 stop:2533 length:1251 start_codon:yes stop_codon:yes gene_type:complete
MNLKRVVVTGIGALTPIGNTSEEFWKALSTGVSGAAPITKFDASLFKTQFACEIKNLDLDQFIDRKEARKMDPFTQYAMITADEAMADSGLDLEKIDKSRAGVIWGSGIGGLKTFQDEVTDFAKGDGTPRFNPFFIPKMIADISAGFISIKYGFRGPNFVTVSACASATNALIDAFNYIRLGKADIFISGGSEAAVTEAGIGGFNAMKALSQRNDSPETASRPFDKDRDGFVLGEGAGALILEEYEHAKARGAKIYAEIVGGGMSADANHITAPHPEGLGARSVMESALDDANLKPEDIDYINVHGTSTPLGDVSETKAIQKVFGEHAYKLNISSTKSMTGHLLGAAGAIEAIASIFAIKHSLIPPTINHFTDDETFDPGLNLTFNKAQQREVNYALSNTFGFGGHNCSVIFKKYN